MESETVTRTLLNTTAIRKITVGSVNAPKEYHFQVGHTMDISGKKDRSKLLHTTKISYDENARLLFGQDRYYVWGKLDNEGDAFVWKCIINQPVVLEFFEPQE